MDSINKKKTGYFLIIFTAILALAGILSRDPIAQDVSYHLFVDTREIWSIPNFWNVVSNLPFVLVGLLGLYKLKFPDKLKVINDTNIAYILLFFGTFLVGFGSGYYHLAPDNQTLVWDRLPMTIAFMALLVASCSGPTHRATKELTPRYSHAFEMRYGLFIHSTFIRN